MKGFRLFAILISIFLFSDNVLILQAEENKPTDIEIMNSEYTKPPDVNDNVEITSESNVENILKKVDYYYASRDFDKAIELCELALKRTNDRNLIAMINFSLSSNYLEKGIEAYRRNKDDSFYKLSIQCAKKCLEVFPNTWQALGNIGSAYLNMEDYKQSAFYFSEAEKYLDKNSPIYAEIELHRKLAEEMSRKN
ncbi:MAG: hypothetical protein V1893_03545 [Candidatus Omnitrophota bacterium]